MNKQSSLIGSCVILMLVGVCVFVALGGSILLGVQNRTTQAFGEPATNLSQQQRIYLSIQLLLQEKNLIFPAQSLTETRPFRVELGEATPSILQRLEIEGVIPSAEALRAYLVYKGIDTTLQAGDYQISPSMTPIEVALALQDAVPSSVNFSILPGWRLEEIAQSLPTSGLTITPHEFLIAARSGTYPVSQEYSIPASASLEGFLYPGIYQFRRDVPMNEFINTILGNFDQQLTADIQQGFNRQGLTVYEGVTLASIVEREAVVTEEMPLIASVFLNRRTIDMKLDSDPTVQYAIGFNQAQNTWWTNPLSLDDLQVDSPYNTYRYPGFPPGPIANPSPDALKAVAFPAQTPYYYFRAACDNSGRHLFAETFREHIGNECP
jgi:UPF0755 protein